MKRQVFVGSTSSLNSIFKSKNYQIRRKKRQGRKLGNKQKQIINQKYIDNIREINRLDIL
ncbi:hypothetical protein EAJ13_14200 [Bacteroides xylanisolvens]|nr:hypothetical protein DW862_15485 [Bacteroides sp. AM37-9]RYT16333.1 hypothetical protein EAJ13_14200 [Bacteroides xylanisolvens]